MNLGDIRREAAALGFDVQVRSTGHLVLTKCGDSELFYISPYPIDDDRTCYKAMIWLKKQGFIQDIHEVYRTPITPEQRKQSISAIRASILWMILAAIAAEIWFLHQHLLSKGASIIIFVVLLILFSLIIDPIKLRRRGR